MSRLRGDDLAQAFVDLSDALVADFDVVDFLHLLAIRCVALLNVQAAGIMIADRRGALRVMASSSEQARLLELFEVETDEGPGADSYHGGVPVAEPDLGSPGTRWPRFAGRARQAGFRAAHAVPVRLSDDVIGVLNLLTTRPGTLGEADAQVARALANVTAVSLVQHRAILAEQLQRAMNSRITIEQAKGVLAEHLALDMAGAFDELRRFAARVGHRLGDVAEAVTAGDFGPAPGDDGRLRVLLVRRFGVGALARMRAATHTTAVRHGLSERQSAQFVLAVHEAAANAVRHGGGAGQVLLWLRSGNLYAEVSDQGSGIPARHRATVGEPPATPHDGRGLWLISQVCAGVDVETGRTGTRLLLRYPLDSPTTPGPGRTGRSAAG